MQTYIIKTLILTAIFVVVIYIFIFKKIKKNKSRDFDSVQAYHDSYLEKKSLTEYHSRIKSSGSVLSTRMSGDTGSKNSGRTNYVTKYNSTEDYREV